MAARKRSSNQSKLLNRAVKAGRSALRQAQRRLPPDVRKQIDRTVKEGQKTFHTAIKQVETRLDRTARQADLEKAMKRLDELSRQVRNMAAAAAAARTARPRTASRKPAARKPATRKASTRKPAARKSATRKSATRKSAIRKASARKPAAAKSEARTTAPKRTSTRRARMTTRPDTVPPPAPDPNPERPDMGESFG